VQHKELCNLLGEKPEVTVGVAVRPEHFAAIREANGWLHLAEVPAEQDASEFTLLYDGGAALDVLTSRQPDGDGAIAKFLRNRGEGLQQVEYRCEDVNQAAILLREKFGIKAIYPEARAGADGTRVNFFLTQTPDGRKVLIELYEPAPIRFE
jgi:methylmalonyl-CoA/ethylmalonyl-CoA epimerase